MLTSRELARPLAGIVPRPIARPRLWRRRFSGAFAGCALFAVGAGVAHAQTVTYGTLELAAVSGFMGNRQTIAVDDPEGERTLLGVGFTSFQVGAETTYYISPRFGIGGLVSYQRISIDIPARDAAAKIAGGYYGPLAQVRFPLDTRSTFVLCLSGGGIRAAVLNRNTGFGDDVEASPVGRYWLVGGELSFGVSPLASLDAGIRYQSSLFTVPGRVSNEEGKSAGLLFGVGISLYFD